MAVYVDTFTTIPTTQSLDTWSADWTLVAATGVVQGSSTTAGILVPNISTGTDWGLYYYSGGATGDNHYAQIEITETVAGYSCVGPAVRIQTGFVQGYVLIAATSFGGSFGQAIIYRVDDTETESAPLATYNLLSGDLTSGYAFKLEANGSDLTGYINRGAGFVEILSATESTYTTGEVGLFGFGGTDDTSSDNWEGGDLSTGPTITDVDTDEAITATQANVVITGTEFGATQGTGSVTLRDGAITSTQSIDTWAATSIQFDTVQGNVRLGSRTLRVTLDGGTVFVDQAITLNPISGRQYVNLSGTLATAGYRLRTQPDLAAGDQVEWRTTGGSGNVTVNADGSFVADAGVTHFTYRVHDATEWGADIVDEVAPQVVRPATIIRMPGATVAGTGSVAA